jgi:Ca-activated chloride channel family protein
VSFSHPGWLAAGLAVCLCLLWIWRRYDVRQHAALTRFVSPQLSTQLTQSVSIGRRRLRRGLLLASLALLFAALAGPLVGYYWEKVTSRGNEIIFAVDTSRSMSTPDVKPDRLTRAKLAIDDFTQLLDGDAVGLVAFAGDAFLVCPMTLDYGAFHESLNAVDINTIPRGGTNITSAIHEAQAALRRRPGSDKILILVTDGEDLEGEALIAAKAAAQEDRLKIYTIGVGTAQGDLIPLSPERSSGFVKDEAGGFVKSRLDEPALKAIAGATGGLYAPLGAEGQGFETIYKQALAPMLKHDLASRQRKVYIERYQWPLAASLALLLGSVMVGNRRRVRRRVQPAESPLAAAKVTATAVALTTLLLSLSPNRPARASTAGAEEAYKKGDFATAAKEYAAAAKLDPKKPTLQFNAGTAAYRAGQYPQAAQAFQESISRAPSGDTKRLADQEDAYYNLGNTLYRTGQKTEESSPQQTIETWNQAVKAYETALQMRANDADSKFNRDFVKRKIAELKNKQQKPPPQNQNQNQNQKQNPQQGQGQGQGQNQQNPPPNKQPPSQQPQQPPQQQPQQPGPQNQQPPQPPQQPPQPPPPPQNQPQGSPPPGSPQQKPGEGSPPQPKEGGPPSAQQPPASAGQQPNDSDTQRAPGQMSREEARQLLDSQKGEERHAIGLPVAHRENDTPPEKPLKDW